jgi:trehalose 6-phosphate synthase
VRLILVSNRVAIPTESGAHRAGGLEVVWAPTLKRYDGVWFGWSGNVVPRAQVTTKTIEKSKQSYVLTDLAEEDYQEFYEGAAAVQNRRLGLGHSPCKAVPLCRPTPRPLVLKPVWGYAF